ncbi:MAG: hypothetical protein ABSA65_17675 [Acidimicrobiales bacterium]
MTATWRAKFVVALGGAIVGFGILGTGAALAYWLTASSNPGEAVAASLSAPTTPNATVNGSGAITIGWVLPATQLPGAQYEVTRTSGPGNPALVCTVAATVTSCQDSGLIAATSYGYSVVAVLDDWQSSALTTSATTATPTFAISLSASPYTVGTPITVQAITAKIGVSTDTTYTGAKTINWSGLASSPSGQAPAYPSGSMSFINGVASPGATFTAYRAGSNSLTATDANASSVTGTATIAVNASAAAQIAVVSGSGQSATVNTAFANPLVALVTDSYGNPVAGTSVTFAGPSSGAGGIFGSSGCTSNPQTYSCVATTNASGDATSSAFAASTVAGGPYNVSASAAGTNTVNFSETDTAGSAATIAFTSTVSGNRTVSSSASVGPFVVQVQDSFGNAVTNTGPAATVSLTTTSAGMGGHTPFFTTTSGGSSASAVTIANGASSSPSFYYSDTKAGNPTINATATVNSQPVTGSTNGVTMVAATASKLAITSTAFSAAASSSATNGFATTLEDSFGNATTNGSAITIGLSSSSSGAKFAASSGGAGVTNVTLSANTQSLTAYYGDTVAGSPTITVSGSGLSPNGTQTETITAATANNYVFLTSAVSGQASASASVGPITVQEQDTFGNPTTTAETVTLSSSSAGTYIFNTTENATSPTGSTTVSIPAGQSSATFYYGDTKTGGPLIIASGSLTSATQTETITPGALSQLALNPSTSSPTAGTGFTVSLTALDQYGNTDTNYTGSECVAFSGPASSPGGTAPSYPAKGSCASGSAMTFTNGAATGSNAANITLYDAQSVTLTATDNTTSKTGSTSLVVGPATVTKLVFSTEPVGGVAEGTNFATEPVVSVEDSYSNTVTSDTGIHRGQRREHRGQPRLHRQHGQRRCRGGHLRELPDNRHGRRGHLRPKRRPQRAHDGNLVQRRHHRRVRHKARVQHRARRRRRGRQWQHRNRVLRIYQPCHQHLARWWGRVVVHEQPTLGHQRRGHLRRVQDHRPGGQLRPQRHRYKPHHGHEQLVLPHWDRLCPAGQHSGGRSRLQCVADIVKWRHCRRRPDPGLRRPGRQRFGCLLREWWRRHLGESRFERCFHHLRRRGGLVRARLDRDERLDCDHGEPQRNYERPNCRRERVERNSHNGRPGHRHERHRRQHLDQRGGDHSERKRRADHLRCISLLCEHLPTDSLQRVQLFHPESRRVRLLPGLRGVPRGRNVLQHFDDLDRTWLG